MGFGAGLLMTRIQEQHWLLAAPRQGAPFFRAASSTTTFKNLLKSFVQDLFETTLSYKQLSFLWGLSPPSSSTLNSSRKSDHVQRRGWPEAQHPPS